MAKTIYSESHYAYIEKYGKWFSEQLGIADISQDAVAHGDKCRQYAKDFQKAGISFNKGSLVHLLSYAYPFSQTVRDTPTGWVPVNEWIVNMATTNEAITKAFSILPD